MKLKETLTPQQMIELLNGTTVGFFPYMILSEDAFYDKIYELCLGYYLNRSAEKTISPTYERFISLCEQSELLKTPEELIGLLIRSKFIDKWKRIYDVLVLSEYNALINKEYTEAKTGKNTNTDTHNTTKAKIGTNTDNTTYDTNVEDNGNSGTQETTTRSSENTDDVYGFNSNYPVGDTVNNEIVSETIVGDSDKNTSHNIRTKTGTENKIFGVDESETHTGTDTTDIVINENIYKDGRDGTNAELITEELNLRNSQIFFDIVYTDIDSITTLSIYI